MTKRTEIILVIVALLVAVGGYYWSHKSSFTMDAINTVPHMQEFSYTDSTYGFSFSYPKEMVKGEGKIFLPGPVEEAVPAVTFTRIANVVHQSMSGESEPTTNNPKISVAVLQGSIDDIAKDFSVYDKLGENIF